MNDDLISRQAAIKAIVGVFPVDPMRSEFAQGISCGAALAKTYVKQLPSAQPEIEPIDYTDKGKYLRACGFAISQMIERGSSAVVFSIHSDHPVQVRYEDVLEWIDKQLDVIGYSKDGNVSGVEGAEKGR